MGNVVFAWKVQAFHLFILAEWVMLVVALGVGLFSVIQPHRSIRLYQSIMRRLNWLVTPIDEALELRSTRRLGLLLVVLSLLLAAVLACYF